MNLLVSSPIKISILNRHRLIETLSPRQGESVVDEVTNLWGPMAIQIIMIVGEGGFNSLYARAETISQTTFPWLIATSQLSTPDNRFAELIMSLEGQPYEQASSANNLLLTTFTDILASLIGEELTINILHSAWGIDASGISWEEAVNE